MKPLVLLGAQCILTAEACKHRYRTFVSRWAHNLEHPVHVLYFAGLSTGLVDYHTVAGVALVIGLLAFIPSGIGGGFGSGRAVAEFAPSLSAQPSPSASQQHSLRTTADGWGV